MAHWLCLLAVLAAGAGAEDRPLPDPDRFLAEVKKRLQTDSELQSQYAYVETRREVKFDRDGRISEESVKVFENYPGLPGERRWERLIEEDGRPVPAAELARQDAERQRRAREYAQRMAASPREQYERQLRQYERSRSRTNEVVEDVFRVFDVRMAGRERIDGHDTIAFTLTPRAQSQPRTRQGRLMRHFTVRAWVSESDYELVRLDAEAIETMSFGFGVLARIHKGSELTFLRRKINGEVWLPAQSTYTGSARVGLVRTLRRGGTSEYSNYRKFTVDTHSTFAPASD